MKQRIGVLVCFFLCWSLISQAQAPTAVVNGQVRDTSGAAVPNASVEVINDGTNVRYTTETNDEGIYSVPNVPPGTYHIRVSKQGFKTIVHPDITLNVQDAKAIGFILPVGPVSDTVTVEGGTPIINTQDAAVSTVVDRQFAENLPMNGRSFQTLIEMTPGVVLTPSGYEDSGQFSINGQRAASNYWMVDGVSANIGIGTNLTGYPGNGLGGSLGSFSALGGTNSLVSVDALQEFRIQTSTYAPEFGRTPGGQISILTRSGTNQYHGTVFEYLRNDVLDANNWFNTSVTPALPKAKERQNDFGGTFSGPILKDRTFFFFSYEGLRLRLPQTTLTTVPDLNARQSAVPAMQPFLNAYPFDPKQPNLGNGIARFDASYSNPATLDAYSLRIDQRLSDKLNLFGRYNYSPSEIAQRGAPTALSVVSPLRVTTQTGTVGATWSISHSVTNDLRFNYSRTNFSSSYELDNFGGAVPLTSLPFPSPYTTQNGFFQTAIFSLQQGNLPAGLNEQDLQRQINIVDSLAIQTGSHSLKVGVDFRRLSPVYSPYGYLQEPFFSNVQSAENGNLLFSIVAQNLPATFLFRNFGAYAQDTWRIAARLTLTYGLRWDVDVVPQSISGPTFPAVTGFNLNNLSNLALAPAGTAPYKTTYDNFAPRLGVAFQLGQRQDWQTVLRGGFGVFYDLASSGAGNQIGEGEYPFGSLGLNFGGTFPLSASQAAPPPITPTRLNGFFGRLFAFDPNLKLPYTLEWNVALEQGVGKHQAISASYVGAAGRRLIESELVYAPNPNFAQAILLGNAATSTYSALQVQFQRRLSQGLQILASYTWSHSIDTGSAGSAFNTGSNALIGNPNANRGDSDFDIRNAFSAGVTYDVPNPKINAFTSALLHGWSIENSITARSAPPVDVSDANFAQLSNGLAGVIRPDVVPGQPLYLYGAQYAGGKAFNSAAFTNPPTDPSTGNPVRQGDLPRNALRGFGATQWDFAVHRNFPIRESLNLQFRAEMFNVLNHPNFGPPSGFFGLGGFGLSSQMLAQSLSFGGATVGSGGFSPLYQIGGPRSIQLALKLTF